MRDVRFTDNNIVIYNGSNKISRKRFYKRLYRYLRSYYPKVEIYYGINNELVIGHGRVQYDEEFKTNEVDDPNSEFNKKMHELAKIYKENIEAKSQPDSIEDAYSKINYFKQKRFIFNSFALKEIIEKRDYILDHVDKNSEEYKIQLKEKIKDLKRDGIINTIVGLSFFYPFIISALSVKFELAILFFISIVLIAFDFSTILVFFSEGEDQLIEKLVDVKNDLVEIKGIRYRLKQLKKRKTYKPLQAKQKELILQEKKQKDIKDALDLTDIINRVETIKKQLISINNEYSQSLAISLSKAIEKYSNLRYWYKIRPDQVNIIEAKEELSNEVNKVENEVKKLLEQQANNVNQSDFELDYLDSLGKDLSNTQSPGQLSLGKNRGNKNEYY